MGSIETTDRPKEAPALTFDELIRRRAVDEDQSPLLAYPKTKLGITDYELINGKQFNRFIDCAAKSLIKAGVQPVYENTTVGIIGNSDLDYIVTIFALGRLGYTVFLLSPRLAVNACVGLLSGQNSKLLLYGPPYLDISTKSSQEIPLKLLPILTRERYDFEDGTPQFSREGVDSTKEQFKTLIMMHSSGSTGIPRPITYSHKRLMVTLLTSQRLTSFQSMPMFHAHGFVTMIQAIYTRKVIYLFNGNVPQSHDTVVPAIRAANAECVWTVPYVLKLLLEKPDGLEVLKPTKIVSCSGSRCPDELGDTLVNNGIHFGTNFGATEVALIMSSLNRPREDKAWDYLRPVPHAAPYLIFKQIDGDIHECVVLDGHKGKVMTNSNDPPNSYHTKDLFIPHKTLPNAWKFVGRLDDRVTLTNGEKVLPLSIEGRIRKDPLVKEAVVFGVDRPIPGLLLFRAPTPEAENLSDDEYLDAVWPAIEDANSRAEAFSQISRNMVAVIPSNIECPSTDKASIKRAQVYREFAQVIDDIYVKLENSNAGTLKLSVPELEKWVIDTFKSINVTLHDAHADFFAAGVDSLKAIQMRGLILKELDLEGNVKKLPSMVVYECGNAERLAKKLYAIRTGEEVNGHAGSQELETMEKLIEEYSFLEPHVPGTTELTGGSVVVLTGATGSLGSHVLSQLVASSAVSKIYCLLRESDNPSARLLSALESRSFSPLANSEKVTAISSNISAPNLGLPSTVYTNLQQTVTHILHCAWAVNFALPITSFAQQLSGLQNLLALSLSVTTPAPARILFCSSVGAAMATPGTSESSSPVVAEAPIPRLTDATPTGYAQSKLVGERIIQAAVEKAGAAATILRIGQIVPAREIGSQLWSESEAVPLMVRSALVVEALPEELGGGRDECRWLMADDLAKTIVELAGIGATEEKPEELVYNLVHPKTFSWKNEFLPKLKEAGLKFETVSYAEWLDKLRGSSSDVVKNPSKKLLEFWEAATRDRKEVVFQTQKAVKDSRAFEAAGLVSERDMISRMLEAWKSVW